MGDKPVWLVPHNVQNIFVESMSYKTFYIRLGGHICTDAIDVIKLDVERNGEIYPAYLAYDPDNTLDASQIYISLFVQDTEDHNVIYTHRIGDADVASKIWADLPAKLKPVMNIDDLLKVTEFKLETAYGDWRV